ncbi:MAG: hypothetical protein ACOX08_00030 [Methanobacterium sp.]|jgi:hypothetical protein|nr:hypothetical protein [Methanobacterium sp.]
MAKEIAATPVLEGKTAVRFLLKTQDPISPKKKRNLDRIRKEHKADLF